jgi:hypothetical protein
MIATSVAEEGLGILATKLKNQKTTKPKNQQKNQKTNRKTKKPTEKPKNQQKTQKTNSKPKPKNQKNQSQKNKYKNKKKACKQETVAPYPHLVCFMKMCMLLFPPFPSLSVFLCSRLPFLFLHCHFLCQFLCNFFMLVFCVTFLCY